MKEINWVNKHSGQIIQTPVIRESEDPLERKAKAEEQAKVKKINLQAMKKPLLLSEAVSILSID